MKSEKVTMEESNNEIVVQDACILIDLIDLGLIDEFFQLDLSVYTTLPVINEITIPIQKEVINKLMTTNKLHIDSDGTIEDVLTLSNMHAALSFADSSVLEFALRKNAIIFSSDGSLRKISINKELTVRGSLWIIEELFTQKKITRQIAIDKLRIYPVINKRAPVRQIKTLLNKLNKG